MISDRRSMEALDAMGRRYGTRPSALVGEADPVLAFCIDLWAFQFGVQRDRRNSPRG